MRRILILEIFRLALFKSVGLAKEILKALFYKIMEILQIRSNIRSQSL